MDLGSHFLKFGFHCPVSHTLTEGIYCVSEPRQLICSLRSHPHCRSCGMVTGSHNELLISIQNLLLLCWPCTQNQIQSPCQVLWARSFPITGAGLCTLPSWPVLLLQKPTRQSYVDPRAFAQTSSSRPLLSETQEAPPSVPSSLLASALIS